MVQPAHRQNFTPTSLIPDSKKETDAQDSANAINTATGHPSTKLKGNAPSKAFVHKILHPIDKATAWIHKFLIKHLGEEFMGMRRLNAVEKNDLHTKVQALQTNLSKQFFTPEMRTALIQRINTQIENNPGKKEQKQKLEDLLKKLQEYDALPEGSHYDLMVDFLTSGYKEVSDYLDLNRLVQTFFYLEKFKHKDVISIRNEYAFLTPPDSKDLKGRWLLGENDRKLCSDKIQSLINGKSVTNEIVKIKENLKNKEQELVQQKNAFNPKTKHYHKYHRKIQKLEFQIHKIQQLQKIDKPTLFLMEVARSPETEIQNLVLENNIVNFKEIEKFATILDKGIATQEDYTKFIEPLQG